MIKLIEDKRGIDFLSYTVIFIVLNLIVFLSLFIFVARAGTGVSVKEQVYAKQIALLIDQAKPGTTIEIDIFEIYEIVEEQGLENEFINFDFNENKLTVKLEKGKGYSYCYFTELKSGSVSIKDGKTLEIEV